MAKVLIVGAFVAVTAFALILIGWDERRRRRKWYATFAMGRESMNDNVYFTSLGCAEEHRPLCKICRDVMGELCGVDAELIHPDDALKTLLQLQFDGGDWLEFVFRVESAGQLALDDEFNRGCAEPQTSAGLVHHVIATAKPVIGKCRKV